MTSAHADLTVLDVNAVPMAAVDPVEHAHLVEHVPELEDVSVTETVSERNVEMMAATLEIFVTSVHHLKFVELTSDVLEPVHPTAVTLTEPKEFVVTTDVSDLVENVLQYQDRTSDAEMDNAFAVLNVITFNVVLMVVEEIVVLAQVMLLVSTELVLTQFWDAVEMVSANLH